MPGAAELNLGLGRTTAGAARAGWLCCVGMSPCCSGVRCSIKVLRLAPEKLALSLEMVQHRARVSQGLQG